MYAYERYQQNCEFLRNYWVNLLVKFITWNIENALTYAICGYTSRQYIKDN